MIKKVKKVWITVYRFQANKGKTDNYINFTLSTKDWHANFSETLTTDCLIKRKDLKHVCNWELESLNYIALYIASDLALTIVRITRTIQFYEKLCDALDEFLKTIIFEME